MSNSAHGLRAAIDRGEAGDKVDHPDPAAAPLGTDEEAAGTPVSRDVAVLAYKQEVLSRAGKSKAERSVITLVAALAMLFGIGLLLIWISVSLQGQS